MRQSVSADEILRTVSLLAGIDESALKSRTWRRPLKQARIAAAHLLLVHCRLPRADIGLHIGRSDQTVSELTARAKRSLAAGGPAADLIAAAETSLDRGASHSKKRSGVSANSRHTPLLHLRAWRLVARLTRAHLADRARISNDILIRLERDRLASTAEIERLATALGTTPEMLLAAPPVPDPSQVDRWTPGNLWVMQQLAHWRKVCRLTQSQLAERIGVARETISRSEIGRPVTGAVVQRVADALLLAPSSLIGYPDLDAADTVYRTCKDCGGRRPPHGFLRVRGTPYVYLRCRLCRARRKRERYWTDLGEREREKSRARAYKLRRMAAARVAQN
jgi:transcriptional regulator with XRE-family HTH domain